jgi:molybdopterin converting factor subunit 1
MKVSVKTFGISRDILGSRTVEVEFEKDRVGDLRTHLLQQYPQLAGLKSILIAVNEKYAEDDQKLNASDEIALIPPVSGG